ncbi:hypothetical protein [Peribacillus simplex]|uniref:hypothetical protein n=1 Tax=Peribacillus TaxID=2675229 RepID=UPI0036D7ABDB
MQTANAIIIQPVKESKKCPAIKTTTSFLKQIIKNNKRKAVAHWVVAILTKSIGASAVAKLAGFN